ncbi:MAG TPA: hypothetical protein VGW37_11295 [Terriglobia bacterium]|nr:hypothetical protein [Terriglobia bacterium]
MLSINSVRQGTIFPVVTGRNKEQIPQIHFGADDCSVTNDTPENLAKADLRI